MNEISFAETSVSQHEDQFIKAIQLSSLAPDLTFVNTSAKQDKQSHLRPDIAIYWNKNAHSKVMQENKKLEWSVVDVWIENKNRNQDIFRTHAETNPPEDESDLGRPIKSSHQASHICGQLISHSLVLHQKQSRVFSFAIVLFGETGRTTAMGSQWCYLYRSYSIGPKIPTPFSNSSGGSTLSLLPSVDMTPLSPQSRRTDKGVGDAQSTLAVYMDVEKVEVEDLRQILINDDHAMDGQPKPYITWKPIWETKTLFGRSTFRYVSRKKGIFITIYEKQNSYGLIRQSKNFTSGIRWMWICRGNNPEQYDLFIPYAQQIELLHVQGTWQFISTGLLLHPATRSHGLPNDLESFYWVLLYMVMKYRHPNFKVISQDMQDVFDGYRYTGRNHVARGGKGKLSFLDSRVFGPTFIKNTIKILPCIEIIEGLRTVFQDFYHGSNVDPEPCKVQEEKEPDEKTLEAHKKLSSSKWVLTLIEGRLKSNPWINDGGSRYKSFLSHDPTRSSHKRKAEDSNAAKEREMSNKMHRGLFPPSGPSSSSIAFWLARKAVQSCMTDFF
ncbi:hypothetical protein F5148DRAFT_1147842 [Russula earlei]|uniref:Uncharacterized protein n=1 Tax=Russula earlei TaxID=71964 RepID=A0ACC0UEL4_9AGAM|nr:hypothetical protein F5148DRAFT_1147842 [Russula earlei]